jgi:cell division protein FtsB
MGQGIVAKPKEARTLTGRMKAQFMKSRRRVGTFAAFAIALMLGYHVVVGDNGLNVYKQKLAEDKQLAAELQQQQQQNDRLKRHVDHLASDPDAIAYEVHQRLRYAGDREVIVLNDDPASTAQPSPAQK